MGRVNGGGGGVRCLSRLDTAVSKDLDYEAIFSPKNSNPLLDFPVQRKEGKSICLLFRSAEENLLLSALIRTILLHY